MLSLQPPTSDKSVMSNLFYRGNFCAECGCSLDRRPVWRTRYLCDHCDNALGQRAGRRGRRTFAIILLIVILVFPGDRQTVIDRSTLRPDATSFSPPSTDLDQISDDPQTDHIESSDTTLCGARTKKGSPCRRRVSNGMRCYQHLGQPSIIDLPAPEKNR